MCLFVQWVLLGNYLIMDHLSLFWAYFSYGRYRGSAERLGDRIRDWGMLLATRSAGGACA